MWSPDGRQIYSIYSNDFSSYELYCVYKFILGDPGADNGVGGSKSGKFTGAQNFPDLLAPTPLSAPGSPRMI